MSVAEADASTSCFMSTGTSKPDHDDMVTARLLTLADARGLLVTGGSDFHGDAAGRAVGLGRIALPADRFERLSARARPT